MDQKIPPSIIAVILLVIVATAIIVLTLVDSNKTHQPILSGTGITANLPVPATTRIPATDTQRQEFSSPDSTSAGISRADRYSGNAVDECSLVPFKDPGRPLADGFTWENMTVFNYLTAGNYSSPVGKKAAGITTDQAQSIAVMAFPEYIPDRIDIEFSDGSEGSFRSWNFDMHKDEKQLVQGWLDADTGELTMYLIPFWYGEKTQDESNPAITVDNARLTAENEIRKRNGEISLGQMDAQVDPDGNYQFHDSRIINGVPSFSNGFNVGILARTGEVISYSKRWWVPEDAVAKSSVPAISKDAAIAVVERQARACYPESAYSFRIVSADLQWMDNYDLMKFTPKPGVIPLAWHVQFNDKTIRAEDLRSTDDAWVDAQNGTLLSMEYFHNR